MPGIKFNFQITIFKQFQVVITVSSFVGNPVFPIVLCIITSQCTYLDDYVEPYVQNHKKICCTWYIQHLFHQSLKSMQRVFYIYIKMISSISMFKGWLLLQSNTLCLKVGYCYKAIHYCLKVTVTKQYTLCKGWLLL